MNIVYLGVLSCDESAQEKFPLLESDDLLLGAVIYHKDLVSAHLGKTGWRVIAAGTIPKNTISNSSAWGWKSTGYRIITDQELRPDIVDKITEYKENLKSSI
ncbi:MAG: hypothetical protein RI935_360 [Candidatus Parcubacteria bacterium]